MRDELVLRFRPDGTVFMDDTENGITTCRHIGFDDLIAALAPMRKKQKFISGLLPAGCIAVSMEEGGNLCAVVECPLQKAFITYRNTSYPEFPLPRLLFKLEINSGNRVISANVGIPDRGELSEDTQMFHYPFGNVSKFSMCTGTSPIPKAEKLSRLQEIVAFLLELPNNDDNFSAINNKPRLCQRELMELLRNKDRDYYYEHILIPMKNVTLHDFIDE